MEEEKTVVKLGWHRSEAQMKTVLQQHCNNRVYDRTLILFQNLGSSFPFWLRNGKSRAALAKITLRLSFNGLHETLYALKWHLSLVVNNEQMSRSSVRASDVFKPTYLHTSFAYFYS